jgi:hypothetical protein
VQRAEESIDLKRKQLDSHLGEMEALVTAIELAKVGPTPSFLFSFDGASRATLTLGLWLIVFVFNRERAKRSTGGKN